MARQSLGRAILPAILLASGILVAGCAAGSGSEPASTPPQPAQPAPAPAPGNDAAAATDPAPDAPPAGIFTADQSERGRVTFDEVCSECHTTNEFRGRSFQSNWGRRTVYSFFRTVRSTMPDDNPGGLEEQVYLDVAAYILSINGHDPGAAELTADSPMREVRIAPPEAGR